eukprot:sb/3469716/
MLIIRICLENIAILIIAQFVRIGQPIFFLNNSDLNYAIYPCFHNIAKLNCNNTIAVSVAVLLILGIFMTLDKQAAVQLPADPRERYQVSSVMILTTLLFPWYLSFVIHKTYASRHLSETDLIELGPEHADRDNVCFFIKKGPDEAIKKQVRVKYTEDVQVPCTQPGKTQCFETQVKYRNRTKKIYRPSKIPVYHCCEGWTHVEGELGCSAGRPLFVSYKIYK